MTFKIKTQVQAANGFIFDISFKTKSADAINRYADQLYAAGLKPVDQSPLKTQIEPVGARHASPNAVPDKSSQTPPATSRFNGKPAPQPKQIASPDKTGHCINITKVSVQAVQRGGNIGSPKWFIETDTEIKFCIFDLDVLVKGKYITRETAMSEAWQKLGAEITIDPPLPATIERPGKWWELMAVTPSQQHTDTLYPPKEFIPENVVEIIDIEMERKKGGMRDRVIWKGKTDDLDQVIIFSQYNREHIHGVGIDTSTWDLPEPYTKSVTINVRDNKPTHVMTADKVWTVARHHKALFNGDIICHRDQDGDIHYLTISKIETRSNNGPSTIQFEGDHPTIEDTFGTFYVCLTPIPLDAVDIPF